MPPFRHSMPSPLHFSSRNVALGGALLVAVMLSALTPLDRRSLLGALDGCRVTNAAGAEYAFSPSVHDFSGTEGISVFTEACAGPITVVVGGVRTTVPPAGDRSNFTLPNRLEVNRLGVGSFSIYPQEAILDSTAEIWVHTERGRDMVFRFRFHPPTPLADFPPARMAPGDSAPIDLSLHTLALQHEDGSWKTPYTVEAPGIVHGMEFGNDGGDIFRRATLHVRPDAAHGLRRVRVDGQEKTFVVGPPHECEVFDFPERLSPGDSAIVRLVGDCEPITVRDPDDGSMNAVGDVGDEPRVGEGFTVSRASAPAGVPTETQIRIDVVDDAEAGDREIIIGRGTRTFTIEAAPPAVARCVATLLPDTVLPSGHRSRIRDDVNLVVRLSEDCGEVYASLGTLMAPRHIAIPDRPPGLELPSGFRLRRTGRQVIIVPSPYNRESVTLSDGSWYHIFERESGLAVGPDACTISVAGRAETAEGDREATVEVGDAPLEVTLGPGCHREWVGLNDGEDMDLESDDVGPCSGGQNGRESNGLRFCRAPDPRRIPSDIVTVSRIPGAAGGGAVALWAKDRFRERGSTTMRFRAAGAGDAAVGGGGGADASCVLSWDGSCVALVAEVSLSSDDRAIEHATCTRDPRYNVGRLRAMVRRWFNIPAGAPTYAASSAECERVRSAVAPRPSDAAATTAGCIRPGEACTAGGLSCCASGPGVPPLSCAPVGGAAESGGTFCVLTARPGGGSSPAGRLIAGSPCRPGQCGIGQTGNPKLVCPPGPEPACCLNRPDGGADCWDRDRIPGTNPGAYQLGETAYRLQMLLAPALQFCNAHRAYVMNNPMLFAQCTRMGQEYDFQQETMKQLLGQ